MTSCNHFKQGICSWSMISRFTQWKTKSVWWTILVTLIIVLQTTVQAQLCEKINACKCKLPNGKLIDLSKIGNKDGKSPKFDYAKPDDGSSQFYEYSFNGCYAYTDSFCSNQVACQRNTIGTIVGYPLGTPDTADYTDGKVLNFTAQDPIDGRVRYTRVKLICDEKGTADSSSVRRLGEPASNWIYEYELTSKCACGNGCAAPDTGLSVGSILCILFSVLVIVYFVGGVLFMKFGKGAEGKETIPNVKLWSDFPFLVKDGTMYVVSFIKPGAGKSGYDTNI